MNVGITGAGGFIGRHLVAAAVARGHGVRALVHRTAAPPGVESRTIDLTVPQGLDAALDGLDAIVHAGAHVPAVLTDPGEARACFEVNTLGTLAILEAAGRAAVLRFVLISGNIYRFGLMPVAEDGAIDPSPLAPYYLASKASADYLAGQVARAGTLAVSIVRPSAVYGPGLRRGMMATFVRQLERREPVTINDGGRYRADMVHVADVAAAVVAVLDRGLAGPVNIGAGVTTGPVEVAQTLARILGAPPALIEVRPATEEGLGGFAPLSIARARAELDYAPRSLEAGLADYVRWWKGAA